MLLIRCPWCGERHQSEFTYGGEAHIARPADPGSVSDEAWARYLYLRKNPKGYHRERWLHGFGCRRWFNSIRHTVSDAFVVTYKPGDPVPPMPEE
jgi:sarcosine oxidase subunit delta